MTLQRWFGLALVLTPLAIVLGAYAWMIGIVPTLVIFACAILGGVMIGVGLTLLNPPKDVAP